MASPPNPNLDTSGLPQYGFGADVDFGTLIASNHFLFRVYTPKAPASRLNGPYFIAPKFDARYNSPLEDSLWTKAFDIDPPKMPIGTYDDVVRHMDWTTRVSSPFISTSFSFIWSIWEALRRYHLGVKKDVEIAIIDARAVSNRAVTAVQLLRESVPSERRGEHWKWYRFSQESQSVLVHGHIPAHAVLASIPLLPLLEKLPSYFLRSPIADVAKPNILASIGWDYTEKKRSYRSFCQEMSNRFLQLSPEARLQDSTTGSVRLAMSFLRPWFHRSVVEDLDRAVVALCALSYSIAQWPGKWWTQEHTEICDLIRAIVFSIAEEILESHRGQKSIEVELTRIIAECDASEDSNSIETLLEEATATGQGMSSSPLSPIATPITIEPITVSPSPFVLVPPSAISRSRSREAHTPITPPESPTRPFTRARPIPRSSSPVPSISPCPSPIMVPATLGAPLEHIVPPSPTTDESSSPTSSIVALPLEEPLPLGPSSSVIEPASQSISLPLLILPPVLMIEPLPSNLSPQEESQPQTDVPPPTAKEPQLAEAIPKERSKGYRPSPSMVETASCLATGFLVGAFITLCILTPQRRTLLHLT